MEIEKIAHEITMVLLQGQYASRPAANTDFAKSAAKEYVDCKQAIIGRLKELSAQDGI